MDHYYAMICSFSFNFILTRSANRLLFVAVAPGDGPRLWSVATDFEIPLLVTMAKASKAVWDTLQTPEGLAVTLVDHARFIQLE